MTHTINFELPNNKFQLNDENIENIILSKNHMEIVTEERWRLPVKYITSKESACKLLSNITNNKRSNVGQLKQQEQK